MNVRWYLYLHEKGHTNSLSPDQKKSRSAKHEKVSSCLEVRTPLFKHLLLASSTTNEPSSWKNTSVVTTPGLPTRIYGTHIKRCLKQICASSIIFIATHHFVRKALRISHQRTPLSVALWTKSLSLEVLKTMALRWFWDIKALYMHSSPGLKSVFLTQMCGSRLRSMQLGCLCTRGYNKQGSPLPHSPDNFANPSFCRKGNIQISHQRAPLPTASWTRWS